MTTVYSIYSTSFIQVQNSIDFSLIDLFSHCIHENQLCGINCCHFSVRLSKETNEVSSDLYTFQECDKNNICFTEDFTSPKYSSEIVYIYWKHLVLLCSDVFKLEVSRGISNIVLNRFEKNSLRYLYKGNMSISSSAISVLKEIVRVGNDLVIKSLSCL